MYVHPAKVVHYNTQEEGCVAAPCSVCSFCMYNCMCYNNLHTKLFSVESLLLCMDKCVNTVSAFIYGLG